MIASAKFLLPFSLLIAAGESLRSVIAPPVQSAALDAVMSQLAQPFSQTVNSSAAAPFIVTAPAGAAHYSHLLPLTLAAVWLIGFFVIAFSWTRRWWEIRAVVRNSFWMTSAEEVPSLYAAHAETWHIRDSSPCTPSTGEPHRSPISATAQDRDCT